MGWIANPDRRLVPGEVYRLRCTFRGAYNTFNRGLVETKFRLEAAAKGFRVRRVETFPPMIVAHTSSLAPWSATMEFEVNPSGASQAGIDPRAALGVAALVITIALSFTLIESKLEKLVTVIGDTIVKPPLDFLQQLLSPGTLVLAFAAFAVFFLARRR
jgi:hypothetical protein